MGRPVRGTRCYPEPAERGESPPARCVAVVSRIDREDGGSGAGEIAHREGLG